MLMEFRSLVAAIEAYLKQLLSESPEGWIEVRRKEIAERFDCVPSQVTYVLNTRFNPKNGYLVESRRGGSGYIRIWKLGVAPPQIAEKKVLGEGIDSDLKRWLYELTQRGILTEREFALLNRAFEMLEENLPSEKRHACKLQLLREVLGEWGFL